MGEKGDTGPMGEPGRPGQMGIKGEKGLVGNPGPRVSGFVLNVLKCYPHKITMNELYVRKSY